MSTLGLTAIGQDTVQHVMAWDMYHFFFSVSLTTLLENDTETNVGIIPTSTPIKMFIYWVIVNTMECSYGNM